MKKHTLVISVLSAFFIVGCSKSTNNDTSKFTLPPEMAHCTIHKLKSENLTTLYVTFCPHADTTTRNEGKSAVTNSVIQEVPMQFDSNFEKRPMTPEEYTEYYKKKYRH